MKNENQVLVCLSMDSVADAVPDLVPLFAFGKTEYTNAENQPDHYVFLEADADALKAEFDRRGVDGMIDYNHQQLRAKTNGQPAPAAGWYPEMVKTPAGLSIKTAWTDRAKEFIANKEYRYTSPLFYKDSLTNRITRLINVALTNIPGTDRQQALIALELRATECDIPALPVSDLPSKSPITSHQSLNNNLKGGNMSNKKLFELVGLEMPVAEDQQLIALEGAIGKLVNDNNSLKNENSTLKTEKGALQTEVADFKKKEESVALETAITDGIAKNKLTNANADKLRKKPLAEVLTVLELLPENAVPVDRAPEGKKDEVVALSPEDIAYCARHGYDQAEFAKAKKK